MSVLILICAEEHYHDNLDTENYGVNQMNLYPSDRYSDDAIKKRFDGSRYDYTNPLHAIYFTGVNNVTSK